MTTSTRNTAIRPDASIRPNAAVHTDESGRRTVVVPETGPADTPPQARRDTNSLQASDVVALLGAMIAGIFVAVFLFTQSLPLAGVLSFLVIAYLAFVALYALIVRLGNPGPAVSDRIAAVVVHSLGFVMLFALAVVVVFTIGRGAISLPNLNMYTQDMSSAGPLDPLSVGGVLHAIVGTLIQISIALAISIPLGITCAVFLTEVPGRYARLVRTVCEAMTALPSIVAGLFIYATVVLILGFERCGFAAALAITVMMLPIIIRSADVVLRLVPGNLKEASYALGAGQWTTVWNVVLPTSRSGLTTAIILGTARGIGETSPVLLTAGYTQFMNFDPFHGSMVSLPLTVFNFVKSPEPTMVARGFGTAAVLMVLVLILFGLARVIGGKPAGVQSRRQYRRAIRRSQADLARMQHAPATANDDGRAARPRPARRRVPDRPPGHDDADNNRDDGIEKGPRR